MQFEQIPVPFFRSTSAQAQPPGQAMKSEQPQILQTASPAIAFFI
jgi:hypothetical protein